MNTNNHFKASEGKVFRRLSDKRIFGNELYLGYIYYIGKIKLYEPLLECIEHYEEVDEGTEDNDSIIIEINEGRLYVYGMNMGIPESMDYKGLKSAIIKVKYSNDDQIAIILNREDSTEDEVRYQEMQRWREFAADVAKKVVAGLG